MPTEAEFKRLKLDAKYQLLKKEGEFLASRIYTDYNIHLFALDGYYVEMWMKLGLNHLYWIEVVSRRDTLEQYADNLDLDI